MSSQFSVLSFQLGPVAGLLPETIVYRLGWTLVHFVWQGTVVAILVALVLAALRRSANARYVAGCAGLLLMVVAAGVTLFVVGRPADKAVIRQPVDADSTDAVEVGMAGVVGGAGDLPIEALSDAENTPPKPPLAKGGKDGGQDAGSTTEGGRDARPPELAAARWQRVLVGKLEPFLPWCVAGWLVGMLALSVRLLGGWVQVQRVRRDRSGEISDWSFQISEARAVVTELAGRLRVSRPVRLLVSAAAQAPMAIGWLRPVILLPAGALTGLTPEQLRAVLAHELAHIRRYDYLVNLLQSVVETVLFYHPAVWWVSRQIRVEREHCCDDAAVAACGNVLSYARALEQMESLRSESVWLAVAATSGSLLARIRRLVGARKENADRSTRWMAGLIAIGMTLAIAAGLHLTALGSDSMVKGGNTDDTRTAFKRTLPSGIAIELLGIAQSPTGPAGWWRPDGSKVDAAPLQESTPEPAGDSTGRRYQFAFQVAGGDPRDLRYKFGDTRIATSGIAAKDARGERLRHIGAVIALGPADLEGEIDLEVGIPVGGPETVASQRPDRMIPVTYADGGVVFHKPREKAGGFDLEVAYTDHEPQRESYVVVYDKAGKAHRSNGGTFAKAKGFVSATFTFNELPLEKLDRIELKTQAIEWAEFRHVALKPGKKTLPTAAVATQPAATQGASSIAVSGIVLLPDGKPAAGAEVVMVAPKHEARFEGTRYAGQIHVSTEKALQGMSVRTNAQGRFEFSEECDGYALVAVHGEGCVDVYRPPGLNTYELRLQPWARVEGTLYRGQAAAPRHALSVSCPRAYAARGRDENPWNNNGASIRFRQKLQADEAGRFVIEKAPPGRCAIRPEMTYGILGGDLEVELKAGETRRLSAGAGRTVKGRLVAERGSGLMLTPENTRLSVNLYPPSISGPVDQIDSVLQAYQAFLRSPEGAPYSRHSVPVSKDGSFEIPDLPPGIYLLQARVFHPTDLSRGYPVLAEIGWRSEKLTVTDLGEGPGGKPVELGKLTAHATGDVPKSPAGSGVATRPAGSDKQRAQGRVELDRRIPVSITAPAGEHYTASTKWIEFSRAGGHWRAKIHVDYPSGPKTRWRASVQILGDDGRVLRQGFAELENSGIILGVPLQESQVLDVPLGPDEDGIAGKPFVLAFEALPPRKSAEKRQ